MLRGNRLKECRIKKGLTQDELGSLVGVGKSAICCYEKETRNPSLETISVLILPTKTFTIRLNITAFAERK